MTLQTLVQQALADAFRITECGECVRVTTHCLYPSNALVKVMVRGGFNQFVVSDEGAALGEIESAGAQIQKPDRMLRHLLFKQGLSIENGLISSPYCDRSGLAAAIALVANASQEVAEYLFAHIKVKRHRNFKALLRQFLELRFATQIREDVVVGQSNKPHKFEHLITLDGKRIIVDPVMHDASSINSRVVAHLDVRLANYADLEQRIVYDDEEDWKAEDINLLLQGTQIVTPFSKVHDVFTRLAERSKNH